jgi:4-amino-4-deoxy-L-arabinose transferase-like glycosyltransferase
MTMSGPRPRQESGSRARSLVLLAVLAFSAGLSLWCIHEYQAGPFAGVPMGDEEAYVNWAQRIAAGDLLGSEPFYQDPLYPYLLAGLFALFGPNLLLVRLIQAAMIVASVGLVDWTGRRMMSPAAALAGTVLFALYGGLYFFELLIIKTALAVLLAAAVCALGVWAAERPAGGRLAALGAALGLLSLTRGNVLIIAPLAAAWAYLLPPAAARPARLARAGVLLGACLLMLLPATARNYAVSGEFVLTTSQAGTNFYIGNNPRADGAYTLLDNIRGNPLFQAEDFRLAAQRRTGRTMTGPEASHYWFGEAWDWMRGHPAAVARLELKKAFLLVNHYEVPDNKSYYLVRRDLVLALRLAGLGFGWWFGPALAGMVLLVRREPKARFPAGFALVYALSLLAFFVVSRYRLPLLPALAPFAGYFLSTVAAHLRRRQFRPVIAPAALAAALLIVGLWPKSEPPPVTAYSYYLLGNAYFRSNQPGPALACYDRARPVLAAMDEIGIMWERSVDAAGPDDLPALLATADRSARDPAALMVIGRRLEALKLPDQAITVYEAALDPAPDYYPALARLAWLYATTPGKIDPGRAAGDLARAALLRPDYRQGQDYADTARAIAAAYLAAGDTSNIK